MAKEQRNNTLRKIYIYIIIIKYKLFKINRNKIIKL